MNSSSILTTRRLESALDWLAVHNVAFHSEEDFQHELAFHLKMLLRRTKVRLEKNFPVLGDKSRVDMYIPELRTAIELKYHKSAFKYGTFDLADAQEQEQACYLFWEDVSRIEQLISHHDVDSGYAIMLSNMQRIWQPSRSFNGTRFDEFRLYDSRENISGILNWHYKEGSTAKQQPPITLVGNYRVSWKDYCRHDDKKNGVFRYLLLHIGCA